jgi:DNA modification methylase
MINTVIHGDCREVMSEIDDIDNLVIITDPPYPAWQPRILVEDISGLRENRNMWIYPAQDWLKMS